MSAPFSKRFIFDQGQVNITNYPGPPAGKIWVIRDVDVYANVGITAAKIFLSIHNPTLGIFPAFMLAKIAATSDDVVQWRGRQVMYAGEDLHFNPNGQATDITVSGYELNA